MNAVHQPQRNSASRAAMLATRIANRRIRVGGKTEVPGRVSLSSRGERTESWMTKKHTPSRKQDLVLYKKRISEEIKKKLAAAKAAKTEPPGEVEA